MNHSSKNKNYLIPLAIFVLLGVLLYAFFGTFESQKDQQKEARSPIRLKKGTSLESNSSFSVGEKQLITNAPAMEDIEFAGIPPGTDTFVLVGRPEFGRDRQVIELRKLSSGDILHRFPADIEVHKAKISPNGRYIGLFNHESFQLYDLSTGEKLLENPPDEQTVVQFAFTNDGRELIVSNYGSRIAAFDIESGKKVRLLQKEQDRKSVRKMASIPNSREIALLYDAGIYMMHSKTGKVRKTNLPGHVDSFDISPDGSTLFTVQVPPRRENEESDAKKKQKTVIKEYQISSENVIDTHVLQGRMPRMRVYSNYVALAGDDYVKLIDRSPAPEKNVLTIADSSDQNEGYYDHHALPSITREGNNMLTLSGGRIELKNIESGDTRYFLITDNIGGINYTRARETDISLSGPTVASLDYNESIFISQRGLENWFDVLSSPDYVEHIALSPDGRYVATSGHDAVTLWKLQKQNSKKIWTFEEKRADSLHFSSDASSLMVETHEGAVIKLDVQSKKKMFRVYPDKHGAHLLDVSGSYFAVTGYDEGSYIEIYSMESGTKLKRQWEGGNRVSGSRVSSHAMSAGSRFAVGTDEGEILVWNWKKDIMRKLDVGERSVERLALSGDRPILAVALSGQTTFRIWNWETNERVETFDKHISDIHSLKFNDEQNQLISVSKIGNVFYWDTESGTLLSVQKAYGQPRLPVLSILSSPDPGQLTLDAQFHDHESYEDRHFFFRLTDFKPLERARGVAGWHPLWKRISSEGLVPVGKDLDIDVSHRLKILMLDLDTRASGHLLTQREDQRDLTFYHSNASGSRMYGLTNEDHRDHYLYNLRAGTSRKAPPGLPDSILASASSYDHEFVAVAPGKEKISVQNNKNYFERAKKAREKIIIYRWDENQLKKHQEIVLNGNTDRIQTLQFSPNNTYILAGDGSFIKIYNVQSGEKKWSFDVDEGDVEALSMGPDEKYLIVKTDHRNVLIRNLLKKKWVRKFPVHLDKMKRQIYIHPQKRFFIAETGYNGREIIFRDFPGGDVIGRLSIFKDLEWIFHTPDGTFTGSKQVDRHVHWSFHMRDHLEKIDLWSLRASNFAPNLLSDLVRNPRPSDRED